METIPLTVSDETLRDGEQQIGIFFDSDDKHELAHRIAATGVHQIALMPAIHPSEADLVTQLTDQGLRSQVIASTMMTRACIDQSKACGVRQIILFHAVSDRLLVLRDRTLNQHPDHGGKTIDEDIPAALVQASRQRMVDTVVDHLRYAKAQGLEIVFAAEDASRTDFNALVDCINAVSPYVESVLLCDTVGVLTPEKSYIWIRDLLELIQPTPLSVHYHNDRGMALENTIQAVRAGATGISGTFCGIGERAGNAPLEQVLHGLRLRFGWEVAGIDYDAVDRVTRFMAQRHWRSHPPYSPSAQRHESGIHVSSLLRDRHSYCSLPYDTPDIWFGKWSGCSNIRYLCEQHLGHSLDQAQYEALRAQIKAIAIEQKRSFSVDEVLALIREGVLDYPGSLNAGETRDG